MTLRRLKRMRIGRAGLLAGVIALVFQTIAWGALAMTAMPEGLGNDWAAAVCGNGPQAAEIPLPSAPPDGAPHDHGGCPLCPLVGGLAFTPPLSGPASPVAITSLPAPRWASPPTVTAWFLKTNRSRAPPSAI